MGDGLLYFLPPSYGPDSLPPTFVKEPDVMPDQTEEQDPKDQADEPAQAESQGVDETAEADEAEKSPEDKLKEVITVDLEDVGTLRKRMTVTVPGENIQERLDEQFSELQRERDVRGFRRGRAPRRLVEKTYGSEVRDITKEQLVSQAYLAAVDREDIQVLGDPDLDFDKIELPDEGKDLEFSCEIEIKPEFELPKLEKIPVEKPVVTITDEDVDRQIERLLMRFGRFEPVEEGGDIQEDDLVTADVKATSGDEVIFDETATQFGARPSRVGGIALESLGDDLAGAKVGDQRTIEATVPDDYEKEELRGKPVKIDFTIRDIRRMVLPELTDEFAQMLGLETVDELKAMIRAESESRIDQEIQRGMRNQIRQYLADNTELEVPPGLSSRQTQRAVQQRMIDMQRQGVPEAEIEKHLDELQTTAKEQAANEIKMFFILEKLAEQFEFEVSEDEINGQIAQIAQSSGRRFDRVRDELMRRGGVEALYVNIRDEKVIDRLLQDAEITEVEPEADEEEGASEEPKKKAKKDEGDDLSDET